MRDGGASSDVDRQTCRQARTEDVGRCVRSGLRLETIRNRSCSRNLRNLRALPGNRDLRVPQGNRDLRVPQGIQDLRALPENRDLRVLPGNRDLRALPMAMVSTTTVCPTMGRPTMVCPNPIDRPIVRATARHRSRQACSIQQACSIRQAHSTQRACSIQQARSIRRCRTPCAYTPLMLVNPLGEDRSMTSYSPGVPEGLLRKASPQRCVCLARTFPGCSQPHPGRIFNRPFGCH